MERTMYIAHYGIPRQRWGERRYQNMGKTRKNDFAVTSDELSAYDKLTRQLLFKIPEAMKLSFIDLSLAEFDYRR